MSTRILATFAAVSLSLMVGCATGNESTDTEGTESTESTDTSDNVAAKVETGEAKTDSFTCGCPEGQELSNDGLCYPKCSAGYTGEGPVCWQVCASGFTDTGWFCQRNEHVISANTKHCPWYDKCGVALKKGCSTCPSGYSNDGCTCRKDAYIYAQPSYGRGAGSAFTCSGN